MICDECNQKEATFHSLKIINGIKSEKHLCASCQSSQATKATGVKSLAELFSSFNALSGGVGGMLNKASPKREIKSCSNCGIVLTQVLKEGLLGCPTCYDTFIEILLPMIGKVQNGTVHKGKTPLLAKAKSSKELEIEHLRGELAVAVDEERYEDAGLIQAKIKALLKGERA